jgi:hypothetical protein
VLDYLDSAGIYRCLRINDIGISSEGNIKVFIPPTAIVEPIAYTPAVEKSLKQVVEWWDTVLVEGEQRQCKSLKKVLQLQPPKLTPLEDLDLDDATLD